MRKQQVATGIAMCHGIAGNPCIGGIVKRMAHFHHVALGIVEGLALPATFGSVIMFQRCRLDIALVAVAGTVAAAVTMKVGRT